MTALKRDFVIKVKQDGSQFSERQKKRNKNAKEVMKHMNKVQRLAQPKIITKLSKQEWNSVTLGKMKTWTSPLTGFLSYIFIRSVNSIA